MLDEADHLCDLGFYPAVDKLVGPDAGRQPADAAQRHARRRRRPAGPHPPARPALHELDPNAGSVTTMTHHTLTVGGFRDKVERRWPGWSRPTAARSSSPAPARAPPSWPRRSPTHGVDAVDLHGNLSPAGPRAQPPALLLRQGPGRRRHRRRRPRHPRRRRRPGRPLRRRQRRQGLPAPQRPYGARRPRRRASSRSPRRSAVAPGRAPAAERRRRGAPPRPAHRPQADDGRGARRARPPRPGAHATTCKRPQGGSGGRKPYRGQGHAAASYAGRSKPRRSRRRQGHAVRREARAVGALTSAAGQLRRRSSASSARSARRAPARPAAATAPAPPAGRRSPGR